MITYITPEPEPRKPRKKRPPLKPRDQRSNPGPHWVRDGELVRAYNETSSAGYAALSKAAWASELITLPGKAILSNLIDRMGRDKDTGEAHVSCWPKVETIAKDLALSESTVNRELAQLASDGFINIRDRYGPYGQTSSEYFITHRIVECYQTPGQLCGFDPRSCSSCPHWRRDEQNGECPVVAKWRDFRSKHGVSPSVPDSYVVNEGAEAAPAEKAANEKDPFSDVSHVTPESYGAAEGVHASQMASGGCQPDSHGGVNMTVTGLSTRPKTSVCREA
jgi:AraC-like DNA-binding protein